MRSTRSTRRRARASNPALRLPERPCCVSAWSTLQRISVTRMARHDGHPVRSRCARTDAMRLRCILMVLATLAAIACSNRKALEPGASSSEPGAPSSEPGAPSAAPEGDAPPVSRPASRAPCRTVSECQQRCDAAEDESCVRLGLEMEQGGNLGEAIRVYTESCARRHPAGCLLLALGGADRPSSTEGNSAVDTLEEDCRRRAPQSCWALAMLHGVRPSVDQPGERGLAFAESACELGHGIACFARAEATRRERPAAAERWYRAALALFERDCDAKISEGCTRAAALHSAGSGTEENADRAGQLRHRGEVSLLAAACREGI